MSNITKRFSTKKVIIFCLIFTGVIILANAFITSQLLKSQKKSLNDKYNLQLERINILAYNEGWEECESSMPIDHTHCIPENDICIMDVDEYGYFRVEIEDVEYKKYSNMMKRINYTYADQKRDIAERKQGK